MTETKQFNPYYNRGNINWYKYHMDRAIEDMKWYFKNYRPKKPHWREVVCSCYENRIKPVYTEYLKPYYNNTLKPFYQKRLQKYVRPIKIRIIKYWNYIRCRWHWLKIRYYNYLSKFVVFRMKHKFHVRIPKRFRIDSLETYKINSLELSFNIYVTKPNNLKVYKSSMPVWLMRVEV